jgi:hypothetical protein
MRTATRPRARLRCSTGPDPLVPVSPIHRRESHDGQGLDKQA